jgi:hypothetical protein
LTRTAFALAFALLAPLAGCSSSIPYVPDRPIMRSLPPERARTILRTMLERANLTEISVDAHSFTYRANGVNRFRYIELHPHAYEWHALDATYLIVRPKGEYSGHAPELEADLIWYPIDKKADVESLLDALESLKEYDLAHGEQ